MVERHPSWMSHRLLTWSSHWAIQLLALLATTIAIAITIPPTATIINWFNVIIIGMVVAGLVWSASKHIPGLCLDCFAATPLDGAAEAQKKRRWLELYHTLGTRQLSYTMTGVILGVLLVSLLLPRHLGAAVFPVAIIPLVLRPLLEVVHRPLQPWCPFCHPPRGGDWGTPDDEPNGGGRQRSIQTQQVGASA